MKEKIENFIKGLTKKHWIIAGVSLVVVVAVLVTVIALSSANKPSEGLLYKKDSQLEAYLVAGIGTCKDTDVIIPSEHNDLPVVGITDKAFEGCTKIKSVRIPEGATSIGKESFSDCISLTSITMPYGITSIGKGAFSGCKSLASITIPDSVRNIGDSAFSNCSSLTSIIIPDRVASN